MSKFDEYFVEPMIFSDGSWVASGKLSREEAAAHISECGGPNVDAEDLREDRVRFGFAPESVEDMAGKLCWYTGAKGKGTMPVWVYR